MAHTQKISDIIECVREMAPEDLAEPWDNSGLLIASDKEYTEHVIVCLDMTDAALEEAIKTGSHLIIAHHPLIFTPIKRIDIIKTQSRLLRGLIRNDIALYAAHTNVDKTYGGLNDLLAGIVGLDVPLPDTTDEPLSYYRVGELPEALTIEAFNEYVRTRLKLDNLIVSVPGMYAGSGVATSGAATSGAATGGAPKLIKRVVVMCGSYSFDEARFAALNADALLCGEIKYHDALELAGMGIHIVQAGHHGTERFFIKLVEKWIADRYPGLQIHGVGFAFPPSVIFFGAN